MNIFFFISLQLRALNYSCNCSNVIYEAWKNESDTGHRNIFGFFIQNKKNLCSDEIKNQKSFSSKDAQRCLMCTQLW